VVFVNSALLLLGSDGLAGPKKVYTKDGFIQLTPFGATPVDQAALANGIHTLLENSDSCQKSPDNCVSPIDVQEIQKRANDFRQAMQDAVNTKLSDPNRGKIAYHDEWYVDGPLGLPAHEHHTVTFPSLIQRPNNHPANLVYLQYMVPVRDADCACDYKTALFLHGAPEFTIGVVGEIAKYVGTIENVATALLTFPMYGQRRILPNGKLDAPNSATLFDPEEFNGDFMNFKDKAGTILNLQQAMLDIHLTIDWINSIKRSQEPSSIALSGISLGSFLGLLYEGLEPNRLTGGDAFLAPGSDIAHTISSFLEEPYNQAACYFCSQVRGSNWDPEAQRKNWAEVDSLTWSGQVKNRKILFIDPIYDELFVRKYSYTPMANILKANNKIQENWISTPHNPSQGKSMFYDAFHVFWPMMEYLRFNGKSADPEQCGT
jgi:hypothetical protein